MTSTNNILLLEDNADDRDLTIKLLTRSKIAIEIDVARDGEVALPYLEDQSRPLPALVLLDLKLPRIMGLDVLKRLRANERTSSCLLSR
jgi:two-component system response regulator